MKKTLYDYSGFSLKKLTDKRFSHFLLLGGWLVYFGLYFLTENLIPVEKCIPVHCWLDDIIPFCEWFVIPYVGWYFLIVVSLFWFAMYNVTNFKRLQVFIMTTQALAMICYIALPTRQDLRPEIIPGTSFLEDCVAFLYNFDTNTGVCPSLHCAYSIGIASVWMREKQTTLAVKTFVVVFVVLVCLSTMFIKQHSAVDFFAAIPVCVVAEYVSGKLYKCKFF